MYGKHFASMYTGSMFGAGLHVFGVWGYAISNVGMSHCVELNPRLLAAVLGTDPSAIEAAIAKLCEPDPGSRSKAEDGRRLVREGQYLYRVVNHEHYRAIRDNVERQEYYRIKKRESRARKRKPVKARQAKCPTGQPMSTVGMTMSTHTEAEADTEAIQQQPRAVDVDAEAKRPIDAYNATFGTTLGYGPGNLKASRRALAEGYTLDVMAAVFTAVKQRATPTADWCFTKNREFEFLIRPTYKHHDTKEPVASMLDRIPNELASGRKLKEVS